MARLLRVSRMKCAAASVAATGIRFGLSGPERESDLRFTATSKHLPRLHVAARRRRRLVRHGERLHGPGRPHSSRRPCRLHRLCHRTLRRHHVVRNGSNCDLLLQNLLHAVLLLVSARFALVGERSHHINVDFLLRLVLCVFATTLPNTQDTYLNVSKSLLRGSSSSSMARQGAGPSFPQWPARRPSGPPQTPSEYTYLVISQSLLFVCNTNMNTLIILL